MCHRAAQWFGAASGRSRGPPLAQRRQVACRRLKVPYALQALVRHSRRLKGTGRPAGRLGEAPPPEALGGGCRATSICRRARVSLHGEAVASALMPAARATAASCPLAPPRMHAQKARGFRWWASTCHFMLASLTSPCQSRHSYKQATTLKCTGQRASRRCSWLPLGRHLLRCLRPSHASLHATVSLPAAGPATPRARWSARRWHCRGAACHPGRQRRPCSPCRSRCQLQQAHPGQLIRHGSCRVWACRVGSPPTAPLMAGAGRRAGPARSPSGCAACAAPAGGH